jgi:hypothetical protein
MPADHAQSPLTIRGETAGSAQETLRPASARGAPIELAPQGLRHEADMTSETVCPLRRRWTKLGRV